jgi:hypothetical protein
MSKMASTLLSSREMRGKMEWKREISGFFEGRGR